MIQNQGVNKVILLGRLHGKPEWKIINHEKCLQLQLVTIESFIKKGLERDHYEFHTLRFPDRIIDALAELQEGAELYVEGKISTVTSIDGSGTRRYDCGVIVSKYHVMAKTANEAAVAT
jgi:single-stranded DNA-binding protein